MYSSAISSTEGSGLVDAKHSSQQSTVKEQSPSKLTFSDYPPKYLAQT
jgi:hypothetical protein